MRDAKRRPPGGRAGFLGLLALAVSVSEGLAAALSALAPASALPVVVAAAGPGALEALAEAASAGTRRTPHRYHHSLPLLKVCTVLEPC